METPTVSTEIIFAGETLDLRDMTRSLDLLPTRIHVKGSPKAPGEVWEENWWSYRTEDLETWKLEDSYQPFLALFRDKIAVIQRLQEKYGAESMLYFIVSAHELMPTMHISLEFLQFTCDIKAEIAFDTYINHEE